MTMSHSSLYVIEAAHDGRVLHIACNFRGIADTWSFTYYFDGKLFFYNGQLAMRGEIAQRFGGYAECRAWSNKERLDLYRKDTWVAEANSAHPRFGRLTAAEIVDDSLHIDFVVFNKDGQQVPRWPSGLVNANAWVPIERPVFKVFERMKDMPSWRHMATIRSL
jgi:hypothetical protein